MAVEIKKTTVEQTQVFFSTIADDHAHVTVTRWANGEGYDIAVSGELGERLLSVSDEEWDAIAAAVNAMRVSPPKTGKNHE